MFDIRKLALILALISFAMLPTAVRAQEASEDLPPMPLSNSPSAAYASYNSLSYAQQRARFADEQRAMRMEWNNWIGYSPLRPNMNASYMSNGLQRYYIPRRGVIVSAGPSSQWYW